MNAIPLKTLRFKLSRSVTPVLIIIPIILIGAYAYHQSKNLLEGPSLVIAPAPLVTTLTQPLVTIAGKAERISYLTINHQQIFTNQAGEFAEQLLLARGYNIITVTARDRFGRLKEKILELVYDPEAPPPLYGQERQTS